MNKICEKNQNSNFEKITSAQNPLIKKLVQVANKQSVRNRLGLTILDGPHLTSEYLIKVGVPEICVVSSGKVSQEVMEITTKCAEKNVRIVEVASNLFSKLSPVIDGVGILFLVKIPGLEKGEISQDSFWKSSYAEFENNKGPSKITKIDPTAETLILENIQDPGNFGTILRSAAAFNVEQIICSPDTVSAWSPKVLRAGMGAHFLLNIFENRNLEQEILKLQIPIFATSLKAEKSIFEEELSGTKAWIFGNEGKGVSKNLQNLATKKVIIPQSSKIESLNVAMATTICLSESWRQKLSKNSSK